MKTSIPSKLSHFRKKGALSLAMLAGVFPVVTQAADIQWTGGTASYTNAANWTGGTVPGISDNAINDNGTNNVVQINVGDPDWAVKQIQAGNGAGGAFEQNGQALTLSGTPRALRLGLTTNGLGVYTLSSGTVNYGSGGLAVGEFGRATMNVNGGSITGSGFFAVNLGTTISAVNATMDDGTTTLAGHTWFEQGWYTPDPTRGAPAAGSTFTSEAQADHSYTMAASFAANNAVLIDTNVSSATVTLTSPTALSGLSFLGSSGNGTETIAYTVHHADTSTETGTITMLDWFGAGTIAHRAGGRVRPDGSDIQIINDGPNFPFVYSVDIVLTNTGSAVTSIDLAHSSGTGHAFLLAFSGSTGGDFTPLAVTGYNADPIVEIGTVTYFTGNTNTLNQTAGTINTTGEFWIGNYGGGTFNFSGGTNTMQNWFVLGRSGGHGTMNLSGGELNKTGGGNLLIGTGYQAPIGSAPEGVLNHSGGTINSSGEFSIPENSPATGTYNLSGTGVLNVNNWMQVGRSGGTGVMNMSSGSVTKTGGGNFIVGDNASGTLTQTGGSIDINSGESWIGQGGSANGLYNMGGGSFACNNNWISIGRNGGTGTLNLTNGVFTKAGGGNFAIGGDGGATGTLNQFGGTISNAVNPGSFTYVGQGGGNGTWTMDGGTAVMGTLRLCENGSGSGTVNLNNGMLSVSEVNAGGASSAFNFNGGTILARADNASFFHDAGSASVQAGGAIFDSQGFNITVSQSLTDGGGGGLTKVGTGTLTLTGVNSYSGPTLVNAGTLAVNTDSTASGSYTVASAAQLSVKIQTTNAQLSVASVSCTAPSPALGFDLGAFGNPTNAPLNVTGALDVNGTVTVNVADGLPQFGQFPLIKYGTLTGAGGFAVGSLPLGVGAAISNNVANSSIDLVITNVNLPRWEGQAGGDWDIGVTTNWLNIGNGQPTLYAQGNAVVFDDLATGTTNVNLVTTVNPSSVTINNSALEYNLVGTGKISGSTGLAKQGSGLAIIANTGGNDFTGPTVISGGTLSVSSLANGGLPSAIGASTASPANLVLAGGALSYTGPAVAINRGYSIQTGGGAIDVGNNLTLSGLTTAAPGSGFTKTGPAQLAYTGVGANALSTADYLLRNGTVVFDGSAGGQTNTVQNTFSVAGTVNAVAILTNATLTVNDNAVGNVAGSVGSMTVNSNSTLNVNSWLTLGDAANSVTTFTLNAGTVNVNNGRLFLCSAPGTFATVNINGGLLNKGGDHFVIADGGWNGSGIRTGTVNQVAGTVECNSELWVAQTSPGVGFYNLSGGSLNTHNWTVVGRNGGSGTFNMTGGTFNKNGNGHFIVGDGNGSIGVFNQSSGTLDSTKELWVGQSGTATTGTYNLSGGTLSVHDWVAIGRSGGNGTFNMTGGTFTKDGNGDFLVAAGNDSIGVLNHSGGTINTTKAFLVPQFGNGSTLGTYNLSSNAVCNATTWIAVGRDGGTGAMNVSGGLFAKVGDPGSSFIIGASGPGTLTQTGGTISNTISQSWISEGNTATWDMSGGTAILGFLQLARNSSGVGTFNFNGGLVSATEIAGGSGLATLNLNGGTIKARTSIANFMHDLDAANVLAGGVTVDSDTNTIGIAQALIDGGGNGGLTKLGTGTLYLNGANTYTGLTVVSNGTLGGTGTIAGSVAVVAGAALAPGASIGTLTVGGDLNLNGNLAIELNKSLAQSNDVASVTGGLTNLGTGTVAVTNLGPALTAGDKFTLFNKPVVGGASLTVVGGGVTWTNNLAVDGSITALTGAVSTTPVTLTNSFSGGNLNLSWPADHTGWRLEVQTNQLAVGISTNWFTWPGSAATNAVSIPANPANPTVFFRLVYP